MWTSPPATVTGVARSPTSTREGEPPAASTTDSAASVGTASRQEIPLCQAKQTLDKLLFLLYAVF